MRGDAEVWRKVLHLKKEVEDQQLPFDMQNKSLEFAEENWRKFREKMGISKEDLIELNRWDDSFLIKTIAKWALEDGAISREEYEDMLDTDYEDEIDYQTLRYWYVSKDLTMFVFEKRDYGFSGNECDPFEWVIHEIIVLKFTRGDV